MFLRLVRATVSKGVKREYVRVVEAYRDASGKTRHHTIINLAAGICWRGILISRSLPVCCTAMRGLIEPCAARGSPPLGVGFGAGLGGTSALE